MPTRRSLIGRKRKRSSKDNHHRENRKCRVIETKTKFEHVQLSVVGVPTPTPNVLPVEDEGTKVAIAASSDENARGDTDTTVDDKNCRNTDTNHQGKQEEPNNTLLSKDINNIATQAVETSPVVDGSDDEDDSSVDEGDTTTTGASDTKSNMNSYREDCSCEEEKNIVLPKSARNLAIAYVFVHVLKAPDPFEWKGRGQVAAQIKHILHIPTSTCILSVLKQIWKCHNSGVVYDGLNDDKVRRRAGPKRKLSMTGLEAALVAAAVQKGHSIRHTLALVNVCLQSQNKDRITYHQVQSLRIRLKELEASKEVPTASNALPAFLSGETVDSVQEA